MAGMRESDLFAKNMEAIDLKEDAQRLQRKGDYERALPFMLRSVALREGTHTICLSLSELADLYLEMLQLDKAEATCRRMLKEAHRYDEVNQTRIANECLNDISKARALELTYGTCVQLHDLVSKPQLNGQEGVIRGKQSSGRYLVEVNSSMVLLHRKNFSHSMRVVQTSLAKECTGSLLVTGTTLGGQECASVRLDTEQLFAADLRMRVAKQMGCQPATLKLVLLRGGDSIEDGPSGDERLLRAATRERACEFWDASSDDVAISSVGPSQMDGVASSSYATPRSSSPMTQSDDVTELHPGCVGACR